MGSGTGTLTAKREGWGGYQVKLRIPANVPSQGDPPVEQEFSAGDWSSVVTRKNNLELQYGIRLRLIDTTPK